MSESKLAQKNEERIKAKLQGDSLAFIKDQGEYLLILSNIGYIQALSHKQYP